MRLAIVLLAVILSGCGSLAKQLEIHTTQTEISIFQPSDPRSLDLQDVHWQVLTPEKMSELLLRSTGETMFLALTPDDMEKLFSNVVDLKRYIEQQRAIILYYRQATGKK